MGKERRPQKGKSCKRGGQWHHAAQADEWERAMALWPDEPLVEGVDHTQARPEKILTRGSAQQTRPAGGAK